MDYMIRSWLIEKDDQNVSVASHVHPNIEPRIYSSGHLVSVSVSGYFAHFDKSYRVALLTVTVVWAYLVTKYYRGTRLLVLFLFFSRLFFILNIVLTEIICQAVP